MPPLRAHIECAPTDCAAKRVIGAEIVPPAIRDAKENALRNHVENAEFFCGDAADIAAKLESEACARM